MTEAEERTYFSLWCLLKAPLLMGNDVRSMSAATLAIYSAEEVVAVDQTWCALLKTRNTVLLLMIPSLTFTMINLSIGQYESNMLGALGRLPTTPCFRLGSG